MSCSSNLRVCVFCASSRSCAPEYHETAFRLGTVLAKHGCTVVCGGAGTGSMSSLADGVLSENGRIVGVLPKFMNELEWRYPNLTECITAADMHSRKQVMREGSDAVIALAGGCGTLEELLEVITLKRLGIYLKPVIIVNTNGYYDHFIAMMRHAVDERFMDPRHESMWTVVDSVDEVLSAIAEAGDWHEDARDWAVV